MSTMALLCLGIVPKASAQTFFYVNGFVFDDHNKPLPYVNIRVRGENYGTTTDNQGRYTLKLEGGYYSLIYSFIGFETQVLPLTLSKDEVKNVWMKPQAEALGQVVITHKKRDLAYEVMKKVIENKERYNQQLEGSICEIYLRASELTEEGFKKKEKDKKWFRTGNKKDTADAGDSIYQPPQMAMIESQLTRYFQYPDKYKEIRQGYSKRGETDGLYFTSTTEADLNFYDNLLFSKAISDNALVSPLSTGAFLAYKFSMLGSYYTEDRKIYHIKVVPRKLGNALFEGEIWIYDSLWALKAVDLTLDKSHMKEYDYFKVRQEFTTVQDSIWVLLRQEFVYKTKAGKSTISGKTLVRYSNYQINPVFEKKFFNAELSITTKDAMEKDSAFWNNIRPEPLTKQEQDYAATVDSIKQAHSKKEYMDSIDKAFNRITALKLLFYGQGRINRKKETEAFFAPATSLIQPIMVGGVRISYWCSFIKRFPNKRNVSFAPNLSYGFRNKDIQGSFSASSLYNPFKRSIAFVNFGRSFDLINPYDAYINMFRRSNFYVKNNFSLTHVTELINGVYLNTGFDFEDRKSIGGYKFGEVADKIFANNNPVLFQPYTAFTIDLSVSFTPYQKYLRLPLEKIILGSKYPTFRLGWDKGIPTFLGSSVNYDLFEFSINQEITLGIVGLSKYRFATGRFLNTKSLPIIDMKYMRMGDPYLFTNPLQTFQLLDTTFSTTNWFFEAHYMHHFQGFIENRIPFFKKTGIKTAVGASMMYSVSNNYQHGEIFLGVERVIRILRDRFRLGIYYALSESNKYPPRTGFKFSLEYYDRKNNRWNF